ncbi:MAG: tRNA (adenosine(37)-N6)-dimethylallyltransferase MiaA [Altererythrobacter sp.]|nr:tRNA (adenosine(37)-N6)-dimethylallyltransferase MiaA [Altererythrobacter sp.]
MSMSDPSSKPRLALIAGPTASGKSALAVRLAQTIEGAGRRAVILNADSAQVYADLRVLSARPSEDEMGGIEHRLFGAWDGATPCSAADWSAAAGQAVAALHAEGAMPVLVGGTGLYLRTLMEGIAPVPPIDPAIRAEIRALPQAQARAALEREDAPAAARLAPADTARTMRALEVVRSSGRTLAEWQRERSGGIGSLVDLHPLVLLPDREWLAQRCDRRFAAMMDGGAREEVAALLARGLDPALPIMRAIGVREITGWLEGQLSRDEALLAGQIATRQYGKRQYTWFRRQPPANWPRVESESCFESDIDALFLRILS